MVFVIAALGLIGFYGIVATQTWIRALLWLLSIPSLVTGVVALRQGGLVESFPP